MKQKQKIAWDSPNPGKFVTLWFEELFELPKLVKFHVIGFFNEADTLEFSSILTYYFKEQSIYTQKFAKSHINQNG
jgi:hypothetical protein